MVLIPLMVIGGGVSCAPRDASGDFLRREAEDIQKKTIPLNSRLLERSEARKGSQSKVAQWEFETDWNWAQFGAWLQQQLHHDFAVRRVDGFRLLFARSLDGDTEELLAEPVPGGVLPKVNVTFVSYPD